MARKLSDLAHIKNREQEWTDGLGMHFGTFLTKCRQEEVARRSLTGTINSQGRPDCYAETWED
eukprot:1274304-Heterocapsa_arctica.AAC.1